MVYAEASAILIGMQAVTAMNVEGACDRAAAGAGSDLCGSDFAWQSTFIVTALLTSDEYGTMMYSDLQSVDLGRCATANMATSVVQRA